MEKILSEIKELARVCNLKIATAESCTGGLVSSYLTDISGASAFIEQNFVTYSNEAKEKFLGVQHKTLQEFGAVSEQVAYQMAQGLLKYANASLATTGILGPTGGSLDKPVGLCYISMGLKIADEVKIEVVKFQSNFSENVSEFDKRLGIKKDISYNAISLFVGFLQKNAPKCL